MRHQKRKEINGDFTIMYVGDIFICCLFPTIYKEKSDLPMKI
jgi:hypothetical protein